MNGTQSFTEALKALADQFGRQEGEPTQLDPGREALFSAAALYVAFGIVVLLMQGVGDALPVFATIQHGPILLLLVLGAAYAAFRQKQERIPALVFFMLITQIVVFFVSLLIGGTGIGPGVVMGLLLALNFVAFRRVLGQGTGESIGAGLVLAVLVIGFSVWLVAGSGLGQYAIGS